MDKAIFISLFATLLFMLLEKLIRPCSKLIAMILYALACLALAITGAIIFKMMVM